MSAASALKVHPLERSWYRDVRGEALRRDVPDLELVTPGRWSCPSCGARVGVAARCFACRRLRELAVRVAGVTGATADVAERVVVAAAVVGAPVAEVAGCDGRDPRLALRWAELEVPGREPTSAWSHVTGTMVSDAAAALAGR